MEEKRNELAVKLSDLIEKLYEKFKEAGDDGNVEEMLRISDRIASAADVLMKIRGANTMEAQVAMLEKALSEAARA